MISEEAEVNGSRSETDASKTVVFSVQRQHVKRVTEQILIVVSSMDVQRLKHT